MEIKLKYNSSENCVDVYGSYTEEEVNFFMSVIDCCRFKEENQVQVNLSDFSMTPETFDYIGFTNTELRIAGADSVLGIRVFRKVFISEDFFEVAFDELFLSIINQSFLSIKVVDEAKKKQGVTTKNHGDNTR